MQTRNLLIVVAAALAIAGLLVLFPIYQVQNVGDTSVVLQHNRLTGEAHILSSAKDWKEVKYPQEYKPSSPAKTLPEEAVSKLEGWAGLDGDPSRKNPTRFSGTIYNDTKWNLTNLGVELTALDTERDTVWSRMYIDELEIEPYSTDGFAFEVMTGEQFDEITWHFVGATGRDGSKSGNR